VGFFDRLRISPTLRFIVFGAMSYTVVSFQGSLQALRIVNEVTHFTHYTVAHAHLGVYSFFSMITFGSIYYIGPRLTGREWPSATLIKVHFWASASGIIVYWIGLSWGGFFQGLMLNNPDLPFLEVVRYTIPFLWSRTLAGILMTLGHVAFAVNCWRIFKIRGARLGGPTLFASPIAKEGGSA
jgi:cytochrome c oxidase cbb3-type subunit 1